MKNITEIVYCSYDEKLVFMHENGNATIEPMCMHPELAGKVPEVDAFAYDYVRYHS